MTTTPLDKIVFVLRQSPDWSALAADYEAGREIEERRYKPPVSIPAFPEQIVKHIADWNTLFGLNFFRCREILKGIATIYLKNINDSEVIVVDGIKDCKLSLQQELCCLLS
jgi:hypothetical protein